MVVYPHSIFLDFYAIAPPTNTIDLATLKKTSLAVINAGEELSFGTPQMLDQRFHLEAGMDFSLEGYILLEGKTRLNIRHAITLPANLPKDVPFKIGLMMEDANTAELAIQEEVSHQPRTWKVPLGDLFPDGLYE